MTLQLVSALGTNGRTAAPAERAASGLYARVRRLVHNAGERSAVLSPSAKLAAIYDLAQANEIDRAIDKSWDLVDHLLHAGRLREVDLILDCVDIDVLAPDVIVSLLMATFPVRQQLSSRGAVVEQLRIRLLREDPVEAELVIKHLG